MQTVEEIMYLKRGCYFQMGRIDLPDDNKNYKDPDYWNNRFKAEDSFNNFIFDYLRTKSIHREHKINKGQSIQVIKIPLK